MVSGISGGTNDFVFAPASFAPNSIFGLPAAGLEDDRRRRRSSTRRRSASSTRSPVTLARFEADGGTTNRGNVRMELNAVFGGERTGAAVRIAAS